MLMTRTAQPKVKEAGWQTFSAVSPPSMHLQLATCARFGCPKLRDGWDVRIDTSMRLGEMCADYIRHVTHRRGWTETLDPSGVTIFTFPPGTPCFQDGRDRRAQRLFTVPPHKRKVVDAPTLYVVSAGSNAAVAQQLATRGRPESPIRQHTRGVDWVEHLAESWDKMAHAINT